MRPNLSLPLSSRLAGALAAAALAATPSAPAQPTPCPVFMPATPYVTILDCYGLAVGDLNGDHTNDVVLASNTGGTVSILMGVGGGFLAPEVRYGAGASARSVAIGDLNGDGKPDLAVGNYLPAGTVSILLGNGDGTVQAPLAVTAGSHPTSLAMADMNRDGKLDLAVANDDSHNVSIHLGNGDGTFQPPSFHQAANYVRQLRVADFNNDGNPDVAVADWLGHRISVLLGNGSGTLQPAVGYPVGPYPLFVTSGDLDGDGAEDIVAGDYNYWTDSGMDVSVLRGKGDGTFHEAVHYPLGSRHTEGVGVGDFDRDGKPDVVAANSMLGDISLLRGVGDSSLLPAVHYPAGPVSTTLVVSDMNNDGWPDLVVFNHYPTYGNALIMLNNQCNRPPVAQCRNVTVAAGDDCQASASIDNGSSDPDGDTLTLTQTPPGPYPLGDTPVTLTVTDPEGGSATCSAIVTVTDQTPPVIVCPPVVQVGCSVEPLVPVSFTVTASDNCSAPFLDLSHASGSGFPIGTTVVTAEATDAALNSASCSFEVRRAALGFNGFLAPLDGADGTGGSPTAPLRTYRLGATIPVKFLAFCEGTPVTTGVHTLQAVRWGAPAPFVLAGESSKLKGASPNMIFRLTPTNQWLCNLSTRRGFSPGIWQLIATLSDGSQHTAWIALRK